MSKEEAFKWFAIGCAFVATFEGYYSARGEVYRKDFEKMWKDGIFEKFKTDVDYNWEHDFFDKYNKWNKL